MGTNIFAFLERRGQSGLEIANIHSMCSTFVRCKCVCRANWPPDHKCFSNFPLFARASPSIGSAVRIEAYSYYFHRDQVSAEAEYIFSGYDRCVRVALCVSYLLWQRTCHAWLTGSIHTSSHIPCRSEHMYCTLYNGILGSQHDSLTFFPLINCLL